MIYSILAIIAGLILLVYGADRFVEGAANIARSFGISPLIIGMTIVGIATSAPEVFVGTFAAFDGKTVLAIGNALGSNIANIGLVLGVTVLVKPILVESRTLRREYMIMFVSLCLALGLLLDQDLSMLDGVILLVSLIFIIAIITKLAKDSPEDILADEFKEELDEIKPIGHSGLLFIFGLGLLLGGAQLLVYGAVDIATTLGVSELVIGLTIIAIGTSLPELAASIMSVYKNEADIAVGNVIGSNMFNMLMVLGVPPLIYPDSFGQEVLLRDFYSNVYTDHNDGCNGICTRSR